VTLGLSTQPESRAVDEPGVVAPWIRKVFWANYLAQIAIVITGGVVRLTASGLGCPTWPECVPGSFTPVALQEQSWHKYVEFGNRTLTFVLVILSVAALVAAAWYVRSQRARHLPVRRPVVWLAVVPFAGTFGQAILGGVTVLVKLNPTAVAIHLLFSMVMIYACLLLVKRSGEPGDRPMIVIVRSEIRIAAWLLVAVAAVVIALGTIVTGSGPHAGDATAPRFGFDPRTVSWLHADAVILYLGVLLAIMLALRITDAPKAPRRAILIALAVALSQGVVGYTQYFTGLPWPIVALHMLGACLVWSSAVYVLLCTRTRGIPAPDDTAELIATKAF
jgi:cytochrome c oxidase assembly protein subunit 15